jgi:N-acetylglucosamine-6-phosphate deacetylase
MELKGIDVFSAEAVRIQVARGIVTDVEDLGEEANLPYIAPGFFDIQVNGYRGNDYNAADFGSEQIREIVADLDAAGVTRHFPTIITGPRERTRRNLSIIAEAVSASEDLALAIPGVHLEGPYISSEDGPRGAHDPEFVRDPDWEELSAWQEASRGMIRLVTLAPERPGALEFIRRASAGGVRVALGHTAADARTIEAAVRAGASLSTHLGNGSHGQLPRLKNYIWEQLACDELAASIITDGFHLPDAVIKTFWRAKGKERIILTSDVAVMGGKEPGIYRWGGIDVEVFADGHLGLAGTQYLAGAAHLLDWDIPRLLAASGCSLAEAIAACTVNPARYLDLAGSFTRVQPGSPASLVLFQWKQGDQRLRVQQTIRGGKTV